MKNKKYYLNIIKQIENFRKKNNVKQMNLLRLSFEKDPKRTPFIMSKIYRDDAKISRLIKKLTN